MDSSIRFNMVMEELLETIEDYGEETIVETFRLILDRLDYEVVKRDPGPDEDVESGNVWPEPDPEDDDPFSPTWRYGRVFDKATGTESDLDLMARSFPGKLVPFPRRWT